MISVLSAAAVVLAASGDSASVRVDVSGMDNGAARRAFTQAAKAACLALETPGTAYADIECVRGAADQARRRFVVLQAEKRVRPSQASLATTGAAVMQRASR